MVMAVTVVLVVEVLVTTHLMGELEIPRLLLHHKEIMARCGMVTFGGGGGGGGAAGSTTSTTAGANGGNGTASAISGITNTYAGGGGGGAD
jgi:hypothetical protein